jgi:hypothetical protein
MPVCVAIVLRVASNADGGGGRGTYALLDDKLIAAARDGHSPRSGFLLDRAPASTRATRPCDCSRRRSPRIEGR